MPNIKSDIKRVDVNSKKTAANKSGKSEVRTALKKLNALIEAGDVAGSETQYRVVCSLLDRAVSKGAVHKNTAANRKSGFAMRINALKNA